MAGSSRSGKKRRPAGQPGRSDMEENCLNMLSSVKDTSERLLLLERAIAAARNGVVITDPRQEDNPIIYVNPTFLDLTGYLPDEIVGRNCRFLQGEDREQPAIAEVRCAIREERPITTVLRNYRKDGTLFWNELTVSPVHDQSGKLINFIGIQNDITARKEAETRISEFYSMVSHELRTPLTSIRTSLGLLEEGSGGRLEPDGHKLVEIAYRNTDRLLRLVNDILDVRKMESGKLELRFERVNPGPLVEQVVNELRSTAEQKGIGLDVRNRCQSFIEVDRDRIVQILTNLAANAIKFSPENATVTIEVFNTSDDSVRFSVSDCGAGIPETEFPKLFKRFQQVDSSDSRRKGGSGLGLAISKALVELHGGSIGVDSKIGRGSTFWFAIPVKARKRTGH